MIVAVVLTFNSDASIEKTLAALEQVTKSIYVVDSFSTDGTKEICLSHGCQFVQRPFSNYADQRNWAIDQILSEPWQLHVDADEVLNDALIKTINKLDLNGSDCDGYIFLRRVVFMNKLLRYGGVSRTWHMRLFRSGKGRVEDRLYDQHFICDGKVQILAGEMLDFQNMSLSEWTVRHNRWAEFEAAEVSKPTASTNLKLLGNYKGNVIERKRYLKEYYYKQPMFFRVIVYFLYRYVILLGFLDGVEGLIFHVLQGFWFRFLVDAKIYERAHRDIEKL